MSLYQIIKSLQDTQGNIAKQAILTANEDNVLLKEYMRAVYDPALNYYQSKLPKIKSFGSQTFDSSDISFMLDGLADRTFTGKRAIDALKERLESLDAEGNLLVDLILKGKIGASVGDTMVLETWPDLYFLPPYQRCSLMDAKIKAKFEAAGEFFIQPKLDGTFLYLVVQPDGSAEAITRAGSKYPSWFAQRLATGLKNLGMSTVFVGEAEVFQEIHGKLILLSRQEGNGLLNAVLKGRDEEEFTEYSFSLTAWDILDEDEFKQGIASIPYRGRLEDLNDTLDTFDPPYVGRIATQTVTSLAEAYKIYSEFTAEGLEGAVIKLPHAIWKDGTSRDLIKLKIAFEAEYIVTGVTEGQGKAAGMMGAISVETSDGLLKCDVGTGFSDEQRKNIWLHRATTEESIVGSIVTITANDVISNRTSSTKSLFLPVFSEIRFDKTEADTLERVVAQLNAAKGL